MFEPEEDQEEQAFRAEHEKNASHLFRLTREQLIDKAIQDLFFGNGKMALVFRVALVEERSKVISSTVKEIKDGQARTQRLLVGTLISSLGGAILMIFELIKTHP